MFLKISQNSQENTCARVSFLIKLQKFCEISGKTFFTEHHWATASDSLVLKFPYQFYVGPLCSCIFSFSSPLKYICIYRCGNVWQPLSCVREIDASCDQCILLNSFSHLYTPLLISLTPLLISLLLAKTDSYSFYSAFSRSSTKYGDL